MYLSIDLSTYLSICLLVFLFHFVGLPEVLLVADLSVKYLSIYLSIRLLRYPPISLSVCLSPKVSVGLTPSTHVAGFFAAGHGRCGSYLFIRISIYLSSICLSTM